ncbi:MAG: protoporphyrinogen oxidase [Calditrichia bacterium]
MSKEINTDVLVVGAGISGLATAHFIRKQGLKVAVVEKTDRPGGAIRSERIDGFLVEYGPNSTLDTSPIIHELLADLGIESEMEYANERSKNRYIVRNGRLNALPMSPMAFIRTPHFSGKAKLRLLKEPFIKPAAPEVEETLAEFVVRRLGVEFLDYAIDPFVAGVYAGVPEQLSVKSAFPKLYALEQKYGSLIKGTILGARERKKRGEVSKQSAKLFAFPEGMQTMINALQAEFADSLIVKTNVRFIGKENGVFRVISRGEGGEFQFRTKSLLMTIPAYKYKDLPLDLFVSLHRPFEQLYHPPVTMVYFGFKNNPAARPLDGFGFLIPRKENFQILGTIWSSTIFSRRAPEGGIALTTFVGGSRQPENALLPESRLVDLVHHDLKILLGIEQQPDLVVVQPWPEAIPQYNIGHQQIIEDIERFERQTPGVYISGNFRGGISVGDCIKQAKLMAEKIGSEILQRKNKSNPVKESRTI